MLPPLVFLEVISIQKRGQGAFEYILLLAGVLAVVILAVVILRGGVLAGANNQIAGSLNTYYGAIDACTVLSRFTIHPEGTNATLILCRVFPPASIVVYIYSTPIIFNGSEDSEPNMTFSTDEVGSTRVFMDIVAKNGSALNMSQRHTVSVYVDGQRLLENLAGNEGATTGGPIPTPNEPPEVQLNSPANGLRTIAGTFAFTYTPTDDHGYSSASLYINGSWAAVATNATPITNSSQNSISALVTAGSYEWNVQVCDKGGECRFATSNRTLTLYDHWARFMHDNGNTGYYLGNGPTTLSGNAYLANLSDTLAAELPGNPPIVIAEGIYYATNVSQNKIYAYNETNGNPLFSITLASIRSAPVIADGRLYVANYELAGNVSMYNATTGVSLFNQSIPGRAGGSPAVADGKVFVTFTNYTNSSGGMVTLNASTLALNDSLDLANIAAESAPAVVDGMAYFEVTNTNEGNGYLGCMYENLTLKSAAVLGAGRVGQSAPVVAYGRAYAVNGIRLSIINASTCQGIALFLGGTANFTPAVALGRIYTSYSGDNSQNVYNATSNNPTGEFLFTYGSGNQVYSPAVSANGVVYWAIVNHTFPTPSIVAVNATAAQLLSSLVLQGPMKKNTLYLAGGTQGVSAGPVTVANGKIYVPCYIPPSPAP